MLFNRGDTNLNCVYCDKNHISTSCRIVTDVRSRYNILKNARRCYLCLKKGHVISKCFSNISCVKCKRRHNVSICNLYEDMCHENPHEEKSDVSRVNHVSNSRIPVILQTAGIAVSDPVLYKCHIMCRILMDACSQRSYVTETVRMELNLQTQREERIIIKTFASEGDKVQMLDGVVICVSGKSGEKMYIEALVVPFICSPLENPFLHIIQENYEHLKNLSLADICYVKEKSLTIDLIMGLDYYYSVATGNTIRRNGNEPVAIESIFGWIICGPNLKKQNVSVSVKNVTTALTLQVSSSNETKDDIREELENFWKIEGIDNDETDIYEEFKNEIKFDGNRYIASLPFKPEHDIIPDNYKLSFNRLCSLKSKLMSNANLRKEYQNTYNSYEAYGVVGKVHYLPHRAVIRLDKETTKVRVVFDDSAKSQCTSLNDCIYTGPCLLNGIFGILLRFRMWYIGIISDIK